MTDGAQASAAREPAASPAAPLEEVPLHKRSRAARLIARILESGAMSRTALAEAILVTEPLLEAYGSGRVRIPVDRQVCLALVAIERVPSARRAGHALRAQLRAEIALATDATEVHPAPPPSHRWP